MDFLAGSEFQELLIRKQKEYRLQGYSGAELQQKVLGDPEVTKEIAINAAMENVPIGKIKKLIPQKAQKIVDDAYDKVAKKGKKSPDASNSGPKLLNAPKPSFGTSMSDVSKHLVKNGKLPDNYITKADAKALGWNPKKGNLQDVAPGKSIGGDVFHNKKGKLPSAPGRTWKEADLNYSGGHRKSERLVYSNDGQIYYTSDHYKTFQKLGN